MRSQDLPISEELDFHYLLTLMPPLHNIPEFAWLPELFSIIGVESLLDLSKYAGGEIIRIPTLDELLNSLEALQWFYDVELLKRKEIQGVPYRLLELYRKIHDVYNDANTCEESDCEQDSLA